MNQSHGRGHLRFFATGVASVLAAGASAAPELDQSYPTTCDSLVPLQCAYMNPVDFDWQQEVIAGADGTLTGIDLWFYVSESFPPGPVTFALHTGSPPKVSPALYQTEFEVTLDKMYHLDLSGAGLSLAAGESFTFQISDSVGPYVDATLFATPGDGYAGQLWVRQGDGLWAPFEPDFDWDIAFRTYMEIDAVTTCPGDCADNDGVVGIADFLALLGQWGTAGGSCDDGGDGVGIAEFLQLLGNWGPCP